jgi:hypothetical protein
MDRTPTSYANRAKRQREHEGIETKPSFRDAFAQHLDDAFALRETV